MTTFLSICCASMLTLPAPPAEETPSRLESDPDGWVDLIAEAGAGMEGWTRIPFPPDGELDEASQWSIDPDSGTLICSGRGSHEWLRWDAPATDGVFHIEWRFIPVDEGPDRYNSGIYVRNSADGQIWHQAQTGDASGGYLFALTPVDGEIKRVSTQDDLEDQRVKQAGEWNVFEMIFEGPRIALWVNGAITTEMDAVEALEGHVGLEAEGYLIEFRNVLLKAD
jgi:hypothetical protein